MIRSLLLLTAALLLAACGRAGPERAEPGRREPSANTSGASTDPRTVVPLPADGQQAVLEEMRQLLGALGGALTATAREDTAALLAALRPAGSAAAADPALEALLPTAWKELAERTHTGIDRLAAAIRRSPGGESLKDTVLARLGELSGSCTACHATFRVTVR